MPDFLKNRLKMLLSIQKIMSIGLLKFYRKEIIPRIGVKKSNQKNQNNLSVRAEIRK